MKISKNVQAVKEIESARPHHSSVITCATGLLHWTEEEDVVAPGSKVVYPTSLAFSSRAECFTAANSALGHAALRFHHLSLFPLQLVLKVS